MRNFYSLLGFYAVLPTESLPSWYMDTYVMKGEHYQHVHTMQSGQLLEKRNNLNVLMMNLLDIH